MRGISNSDMTAELLEKISRICGLGRIISAPQPLTGGYMHKMYSLFTENGRYAVKLLDPYIMARPTAAENFAKAEKYERLLEEKGLPIVPALVFGGKKMQHTDGRYFYVYEYFDGKALKDGEITQAHCQKIGLVLADIHSIGRKSEGFVPDMQDINWDGYISRLANIDSELYKLLYDNRGLLYESMEKGNAAKAKLPRDISVCHNDMDSKNVLWKGSRFGIIDLECLDLSSPVTEAFELALCWSGYESCAVDISLMESFVSAYLGSDGSLGCDAETLYHSNCGRLEWLEYNIRKTLGEECAEEDRASAMAQVKETMAHVIYYNDARTDIVNSLENITKGG